MNLNLVIIILYIFLSLQNDIKNGIYNIIFDNLYLSYHKLKLSSTHNFRQNTFFRLRKTDLPFNEIFYNIEEIKTNYKLIFSENKELVFNNENDNRQLWSLIKKDKYHFSIKNKNNSCYIKVDKFKYHCENLHLNEATLFKIINVYDEVNEKQNITDKEIIDEEPIDILIKYIDLKDPNLTRKGIHQIEKDYDNEELRYSIRSILNYIPWVRKIFILMPNEKVRYFKDYNSIKEKIVYVKDEDFLGYDSSNCNAFLFRYWKMKEFGISDNVIVMDDDCFIGKKLKKDDFFYVKEGKVVPSIITSNFIKIDKRSVQNYCNLYEKKAKISHEEQSDDIFDYTKYLTFSFILNIFNISTEESVFLPQFTHNAIPVNLRDVKEIYEIIYRSKYRYATLDCLYRHIGYIQFQIFVVSYTFIKYHRKVKNIPYKYIKFKKALSSNYNYSLLCINKGSEHYSYLSSYKSKIVMEYLFPNPSPYEIIDYSLINLSFNLAFSMDKIIKSNKIKDCKINIKKPNDDSIKLNKEKYYQIITKKEKVYFYYVLILLLFFIQIKFNCGKYKNY